MATGKILWFGGKNGKTGQVNDFGYISVDNQEEDVKVFRDDVPVELQDIFKKDRKKGKGYPVEFDIQDFREGKKLKKKAVNVKSISKFGFFVSLTEIISQDNIHYTIKKIETSNKGKIVQFLTKDDDVNILKKVNSDEIPKEIIRAFCDSTNYQVVKNFISHYFSMVTDVDAAKYVLNKINVLNTQETLEIFTLIYTDYQHLFLISDELRQKLKELSLARYTQLIEKNLWSFDEDTQSKLWAEFVDIIHFSDESSVIFELLQFYLSNVETQDAIKFIVDKIAILEQSKIKEFLDKSFKYNKKVFLESQILHSYLREYNFSQYLKIIKQILELNNQSLHQSTIRDLIEFLSNCSESEQALIWRTISYLENSLEYHGYLWDIAPLEYKQKVIRKKYAEFFALVEEFKNSSYPYSQYISKNYKELYNFDNNDQELAKKWGNSTNSDFMKAKMLSARGAEKLVQYFYQNLGSNVEDIAAHQIDSKSELWRQADIFIDDGNSQILIDVKNARQNVNSSVYSEFCIPKFKEERGQNVVIAGVLSPYLQLKFMNNNGANFRIDNPKYLGELNYSQLQSLTKTFSDSVVRLDMTRGFDPKSYLAPWLFDYNAKFYKEQINTANKLKNLLDDKIPSYEDIKILNKSLYTCISLFIYANKGIPLTWQKRIPLWARQFLKLLYRQDNSLLKLPQVYLSILKHFLMMLSSSENNYNPAKISCLLGDRNNPIKIYDPLGIINDFCQTLDIVWNNRQEARLSDFKIFKFNGKGLLSGKCSDSDLKETTILAYCGGEIEGKGACGKSPLILGRERTCSVCKKLICPGTNDNYCGFCSYKDWYNKILCDEAINRKRKHRQNLDSL
ncbi:hypothetical protein [Synechocystis salina]|uniref:Uncharacterized protein n=1 Tax=Synechocystis salina LEGE 00031 TaxID=1828736 RepID=A0ABR9VMY8_9SYNC|nr:hypothetical protein [Synechocystis salina]MBE9239666.1 hypothetical protein [Synechocystis salina LEGE 00041]MBE9252705.1 hypothetical protein [Synechocystis salina LEGE 00031]